MVCRAQIAQRRVCIAAEKIIRRAHNVRLADARLPTDEDRAARALRDGLPPPHQKVDFLVATDQGRERRRMLGLEAVLRACRTGGLPDLDRLRPAFESHAAEV